MPIPFDTLAAFIVTALLLAFAPGPDNIFVLTQSALKGPWKGVMVTLGLCTGLIVHTTAVALGVAVIFQTSQLAFTALKVVGALYLLYLAWGAWRAGPERLSDGEEARGEYGKLYLRGIIMNVTNPKVAIFFLAFLPQFTDPARGGLVVQMFVLGGVFMACALVAFSAIAFAAGGIRRWLRTSDRGQVLLNRIAALVFVGLAVKLATAQR
ncbi:LysE family translocator [Niveispirillum sp. KHB5.9]|uniref:LysE family translocator n=1 Tax=Niveispirillum sp. KHB5.9 TaxID=3400269 RepID=UPI003A88B082